MRKIETQVEKQGGFRGKRAKGQAIQETRRESARVEGVGEGGCEGTKKVV